MLDKFKVKERNEEELTLLDEVPKSERRFAKLKSKLDSSFWGRFLLLNYNQIKANKSRFLIGFISCVIVVVVVSLLLTVFTNVTVVFLKMAELETGEVDLIVHPGSWTKKESLNFTRIQELIKGDEMLQYATPRLSGSISVYAARLCPQKITYTSDENVVDSQEFTLDPFNATWKYMGLDPNADCRYDKDNCFDDVCPEAVAKRHRAQLYIINSERENNLEIGREWIQNKIPAAKKGEAHISKDLADGMNIKSGDLIYIRLNGSSLLSGVWKERVNNRKEDNNGDDNDNPSESPKARKIREVYERWRRGSGFSDEINQDFVYMPVKVDRIVKGAQGKVSSYDEEVVYMEYDFFLDYATEHIHSMFPSSLQKELKATRLNDYASHVIWNLPPSRVTRYLDSDMRNVEKSVTHFGSQVVYRIGFTEITTEFPVLSSLQQTKYYTVFIGLILNVVIFILLLLASLLIFSLLTIDVESQSFDMAVLRSLGISNARLVYVILLKAFSYSLPSLVLGLFISQMLSIVMSSIFNSATKIGLPWLLSLKSVIYSLGVVILIPFFSSLFPIKEVMGQSINAALDRRRSPATGVVISLERSESAAKLLDVPRIIFGVAVISFGFFIYYIFPLSLLSENLTLLMYILVVLLLGMILGLVLLSMNLQYGLERIVVLVFLWWENTMVLSVLVKNLVTHRQRNRKTTLMYSLSLGFVIFLGVALNIQLEEFLYQQRQSSGAFLKVYSSRNNPIDLESMEQFEKIILDHSDDVEAFTWVTRTMGTHQISNIGKTFSEYGHVSSSAPNFLSASFEQFVKPAKGNPHHFKNHDEILDDLYSVNGSMSILTGSYQKELLALKVSNNHLLIQPSPEQDPSAIKRLKVLSYFDSTPYFHLTKYYHDSPDYLVSLTTYMRLSRGRYKSLDDVPFGNFMLRFKKSATDHDMNVVKGKMASLVAEKQQSDHWNIWDYRQAVVRNSFATVILSYFFGFAIAVAMTICFFSLMSSMYSNIKEQTKEIGILKVLGVTNAALYRIFIYESFVLVFSSSMLGILIGSFVAWTMELQRMLMTQMFVPFLLPYNLIIVVFVFSMFFAFLSSWKPIKALTKEPLVNLLLK